MTDDAPAARGDGLGPQRRPGAHRPLKAVFLAGTTPAAPRHDAILRPERSDHRWFSGASLTTPRTPLALPPDEVGRVWAARRAYPSVLKPMPSRGPPRRRSGARRPPRSVMALSKISTSSASGRAGRRAVGVVAVGPGRAVAVAGDVPGIAFNAQAVTIAAQIAAAEATGGAAGGRAVRQTGAPSAPPRPAGGQPGRTALWRGGRGAGHGRAGGGLEKLIPARGQVTLRPIWTVCILVLLCALDDADTIEGGAGESPRPAPEPLRRG